jgi:uncharacterized membrane protein YccC
MRVIDWLAAKDPDYLALRRAVRGAIVVPVCLALTIEVIGNPAMATFAVFGSFALLILVDIPGPLSQRLINYFLVAATCAVLIVPATVLSQHVWTATVSMAVVGFAIVFVGVISSVLVASTTALLLAWILPVTTAGSVGQIPERVAGWGIGSGLSLLALALVWPAPDSDPLRRKAGDACHALADRVRAQASAVLGPGATARTEDPDMVAAAHAATTELAASFRRTTYRPATLTTGGRAMVRMVDEIDWVSVIAGEYPAALRDVGAIPAVAAVWHAAATVLERCAEVLRPDDEQQLAVARTQLRAALDQLEEKMEAVQFSPTVRSRLRLTSCEPSFRGLELSYAARQVGWNTLLMAEADARPLVDRLLGRVPTGMNRPWQIAGIRVWSHLSLRSAWLHNSVRSACALAVAVLIATSLGVQHAFWVVFGVLSVLRSTALNTGQNALRALAGTVLGFIVGGAIVAGIGTDPAVLWLLLPFAVILSGFAPTAVSFLAGQAAFTATIVILFNLIAPAGWRVGLIRVEDIAIGCAVSLAVGVLFWPRGAAAALGFALDAAYRSSARYLTRAVDVGLDGGGEGVRTESLTAIAASSRLDDAFRQYLAERGAKRVPLAEASSLVTGTVALRLAGDAVVELWRGVDGHTPRLAATGREVSASAAELERWYDELGATLSQHGAAVPEPTSAVDFGADRWAAALASESGTDNEAAAVRVVWTADHLDAARRLQPRLVQAARMAAGRGGSWIM